MPIHDIETRFSFHELRPEDVEKSRKVRAVAFGLAGLIDDTCPDGREKSLAITKLEEAVFWANASIARAQS